MSDQPPPGPPVGGPRGRAYLLDMARKRIGNQLLNILFLELFKQRSVLQLIGKLLLPRRPLRPVEVEQPLLPVLLVSRPWIPRTAAHRLQLWDEDELSCWRSSRKERKLPPQLLLPTPLRVSSPWLLQQLAVTEFPPQQQRRRSWPWVFMFSISNIKAIIFKRAWLFVNRKNLSLSFEFLEVFSCLSFVKKNPFEQ